MTLIALSFFDASGRFSPIRFFITSRPVMNIVDGFHGTGLIQYTNSLALHSLPPDISQKDICNYLQARLSRIAQLFQLKS